MANRNHRYFFFLSILGFILCGLIFVRYSVRFINNPDHILVKMSSALFDLNQIEIVTSDDLNKDDFKIQNLNSGKIVFDKSKYFKGIKNEYGFCLFNVYYKDSLLFEMGHDKFNDWHSNEYVFVFSSNSDSIIPQLIINGPDKNKGDQFIKRIDRNKLGIVDKIVYFDRFNQVCNVERK